jgi:hydroxymethylpyrimidine/phosphomethylpyrimidine kinase
MPKARVLVIAGSDSSGGAGLEADQKVIAAHGCYAMTATTALTAQNTLGVEDIYYTPPAFVRKLIHACISDIGVDVVKTGTSLSNRAMRKKVLIIMKGMLASAETVEVVADSLREYKVATVVVDPVSRGSIFLLGNI